MRKIALSVLMLFTSIAFAAPKPAEYPLTMHVAGSHMVLDVLGKDIDRAQRLDVVIDGSKYELIGRALRANPFDGIGFVPYGLVPVGDYRARLIKKDYKPDYLLFQSYEILFPDGKTPVFDIVGQTE